MDQLWCGVLIWMLELTLYKAGCIHSRKLCFRAGSFFVIDFRCGAAMHPALRKLYRAVHYPEVCSVCITSLTIIPTGTLLDPRIPEGCGRVRSLTVRCLPVPKVDPEGLIGR